MQPKVSIIVPVYNAEKYLHRCVESILSQTFLEYELLLIDDGSPDRSGEICDEYAQKDRRIRVFHKENGGVASARNFGLDNARGEWITFIDADDIISHNFCSAIGKSNVDIVFTESKKFFPKNNEYVDVFSKSLQIITDIHEYKYILSEYVLNLAFRTCWGKFIRRSLIGDTRFVGGQKIGEDTVFIYNIYRDATSIQFSEHSTYYWRVSDELDSVKYKLDVETGILYLGRIYEAYKKLRIFNPKIESFFLFYFFKLLDSDNLSKDSQRWFSSLVVKEIEHYALPMWGTRMKVEYFLWKRPRIAKTYYSILGFLRRKIRG